ncbi:MAG: DMT family transporter [Bacteroidales bacterium]|nr:DMT family transporter [Bacteroidales bacterium]
MLTKAKASPLFAWFALALGIACIGFSAIFVKLADVPGSVATFYRLLFATVAIIPIWMYRGIKMPVRRDLFLILAGSFFFAVDLIMWNTAIPLTTAATATLLANNAPIWLGLITVVVLRQRLPRKFWLGLLVAITGLNVLIGIESWRTMQFNMGDMLSLAAGFFYALYLIYTVEVRKRVNTITFMSLSLIFMVVMMFFTTWFMGHSFTGYSTRTWLSLAGLGLVSHFLGWLCINYALGHLKGSNVSVTLLAQSVVTAILGIYILGEFLSLNQIIGGLIILSGIYIVNRRDTGHRESPANTLAPDQQPTTEPVSEKDR